MKPEYLKVVRRAFASDQSFFEIVHKIQACLGKDYDITDEEVYEVLSDYDHNGIWISQITGRQL